MGPRIPHVLDHFIHSQYLKEYNLEEEDNLPEAKPMMELKKYIMIKNISGELDFKKIKIRLKLWFQQMVDEYTNNDIKNEDDEEEGELQDTDKNQNEFSASTIFNNHFKQLLPSKIKLIEDQKQCFLLEYKDPRK